MDSGGGAFGAGRAGGQFDPIAYIKKPQVIIRLVSLLFSIIVFGCISSKGYQEGTECLYNDKPSNCAFGVAVGVIAFLGLLAFLALDAVFETHISSIQHRKYIVMADMAFSGLWTFMWFVCFCLLADQWRVSHLKDNYGKSAVEAAIAFSFFSIFSFAASTFFAVKHYRAGIQEDFSQPGNYGDPNMAPGGGAGGMGGSSPYGQYAGGSGAETGDPYQSPFGTQGQPAQGQQQGGDYDPPTY